MEPSAFFKLIKPNPQSKTGRLRGWQWSTEAHQTGRAHFGDYEPKPYMKSLLLQNLQLQGPEM